jgi:D-galactose 1-dehydrogenase
VTPIRIALVGLGKIARDQHLPAIAGDDRFELAAVVSRNADLDGVAHFTTLAELLTSDIAVDAVALCTPPQPRHALAHLALAAGKHVMLEKPPGATLSEVEDLRLTAAERGLTLQTTWHSRHAQGVPRLARGWPTRPSAPCASTGARTSASGIPARTGSGRPAAWASSTRASTPCRSPPPSCPGRSS